jgi:hypothetical protein
LRASLLGLLGPSKVEKNSKVIGLVGLVRTRWLSGLTPRGNSLIIKLKKKDICFIA